MNSYGFGKDRMEARARADLEAHFGATAENEVNEAKEFVREALAASRDSDEDARLAQAALWLKKLIGERAALRVNFDQLEIERDEARSLAVELAEALERIAKGEPVLEPTGATADIYGAKDGPQKAAYVRILEHHEIAERALSKARDAGLLGGE